MKVLITSDWHIQSGIYVDICIDYIDYLIYYCKKNDITDIVIAGDIFEKSSRISNDSFIPLFFKLKELKDQGFNVTIILGNHDMFNVSNDSLVETFSPFGKIVKEFEEIEIGGRKIGLLPYTKSVVDVPAKGDVLITHLSIADFTFDNNYHINEKMGMPTDTFSGWNHVFSGHFHKQQEKFNIKFMGSPYQLNFGETGHDKGFIVFDTETDVWERQPYTDAPKYIKMKAAEFKDIDVSNCFVQVEIDGKMDNYLKLKHLLYEKGALSVVPSFKEVSEDIDVIDGDGVEFGSGVKTMLKEYLMNNIDVADVDNSDLVDLFNKVVDL